MSHNNQITLIMKVPGEVGMTKILGEDLLIKIKVANKEEEAAEVVVAKHNKWDFNIYKIRL